MRWQTRVRELAAEMGLAITSGYRTPAHNRAIGGAEGSYHTRGSEAWPGALDIGGDRALLVDFCHAVESEYAGRIHELFLNLHHPDHWYAVKENVHLTHNPEAGHAQHCHVALWDARSS
jgi:Peptidase M15